MTFNQLIELPYSARVIKFSQDMKDEMMNEKCGLNLVHFHPSHWYTRSSSRTCLRVIIGKYEGIKKSITIK